jgi:predicted RND superfamily exporter protein
VDVIKELNRTFHADDPAYYKIPETRELVAQLLLVYEMSGGEDLEKYVSGDFSRATLEMRCQVGPISVMQKLDDNIAAYLEEQPLQATQVQATGVGALWLKFASYITTSQIQGMLLAFCIIAAMLCFIFRSVKIGLLSMIPNLSPVFFTLGYMGWAGIDLDYTRLLIAPLAIGIAVDDTIHLVTRYHMEFRRCGDYAKALENSLLNVGRALIGTTVILVLGFIMNVFHGMETQVIFGKLIAWTIFSALIADFFLMPVLILTLKPFGPEKTDSV